MTIWEQLSLCRNFIAATEAKGEICGGINARNINFTQTFFKHKALLIVYYGMPNTVTVIFPHQLFQNHPGLQKNAAVYLVEEWLFFKQYNFHQQKLILHRASMKFYESWLKNQQYKVHYAETHSLESDCRKLVQALAKQNTTDIHIANPTDNWLLKRMQKACTLNNIKLQVHATPNFLNKPNDVAAFFNNRKTYFQTDFYTWQRKQRNILLEKM
jgi:deoxyribodipyrimidine photolyase-related protein